AFRCFAVPAAIFELLTQKLLSQCVVRFFEIRADPENSAVDTGLRFAVQERPVVEPPEHKPPVDAVDHFTSLLACGIEPEVLQHGKSVEGNEQVPVLLRQIGSPPRGTSTPLAGRRLEGEKLGSPAFGCHTRPLN